MSSSNIYCVYLTVYRGNKLPMFYIGSSNVDKINKGYHGSVLSSEYKEIWKSELKNSPELFITRVISTHKTRQEAYQTEERLQKTQNVISSQLFINKAIANKTFNNFGKKDSIETKQKKSNSHKGKKVWNAGYTAETHPSMLKISNSNKGKTPWNKGKTDIIITKEFRQKCSIGQTGRKHSAESCAKRSAALKGKTKPIARCCCIVCKRETTTSRLLSHYDERYPRRQRVLCGCVIQCDPFEVGPELFSQHKNI